MPQWDDGSLTLDALEGAILLDAQGDLEAAAVAYRQGFTKLAGLLGSERNRAARRRAMAQLKQFEERAREIEDFLYNQRDQPIRTKDDVARVEGLCATERDEEIIERHKGRQASAWGKVCGLDEAKAFLSEQVVLPCRFDSLFAERRSSSRKWKSIVLHGPPQVGKRFLLDTIAQVLSPLEPRVKVFRIDCARMCSGACAGPAEIEVRALFAEALLRAQDDKQSVILITDLDLLNAQDLQRVVCLAAGRKYQINDALAARVKSEILLGMRTLKREHDGLFVVATTDRPWDLCSALRRRFDKRIFCPLPNEKERRGMVSALLEQNGIGPISDDALRSSTAARQSLNQDSSSPRADISEEKACSDGGNDAPSAGSVVDHEGEFQEQAESSDLLAAVCDFVVENTEGHSAGSLFTVVHEALSLPSRERQGKEGAKFLEHGFEEIKIRRPNFSDFSESIRTNLPASTLDQKQLARYNTAFPG